MSSTFLNKEHVVTFISMTPSFGYFIKDDIQLFAALNYKAYIFEDNTETMSEFGLGTKFHHAIPIGSLYAGASFYADKIEYPDAVILEAGYLAKLNPSVWIDVGADYQISLDPGDFTILTVSVGLAVFLL